MHFITSDRTSTSISSYMFGPQIVSAQDNDVLFRTAQVTGAPVPCWIAADVHNKGLVDIG
jgi:hypothetical protein